ncbi:hypothetical protein N7519_000759 [Penicillium mononematosum]|uniref:uncharacterized protein n=1 Tax=Penicillium mononematosum TaxID=268346 RepID=UPI00254889B1|nr:uncharacterized protein N7519_000759 [Penicillium mononematosum]KAJ6190738.1 hypothetical protein N7519_000759 [Penicillium mononematosum]
MIDVLAFKPPNSHVTTALGQVFLPSFDSTRSIALFSLYLACWLQILDIDRRWHGASGRYQSLSKHEPPDLSARTDRIGQGKVQEARRVYRSRHRE